MMSSARLFLLAAAMAMGGFLVSPAHALTATTVQPALMKGQAVAKPVEQVGYRAYYYQPYYGYYRPYYPRFAYYPGYYDDYYDDDYYPYAYGYGYPYAYGAPIVGLGIGFGGWGWGGHWGHWGGGHLK